MTNNRRSPVFINTLLNIHSGIKTSYSVSQDTPAVQGAIDCLLKASLITQVSGAVLGRSEFDLTLRGKAHVTQLLNLPLPVEKNIWANAAGEVIE